jgi:hypothetical protein
MLGETKEFVEVLRGLGEHERVEELWLEALDTRRANHGDDDEIVGDIYFELARNAAAEGQSDSALEWLRQAVRCGWAEVDEVRSAREFESLAGDPELEAVLSQIETP